MDYSKALAKQLAKSHGRKIVLISEGVLGTYLVQTFEQMESTLNRYIDIRKNYGEGVFYLPEDLVHKENEYFIIVAIYSGHKRVVEELMRGGYRYDYDCSVSSTSVYVEEIDMVDPLLGYTRDAEVCPGIVAYGESKGENDLLVLILGNSTTDSSTANLHSWPYYLYQKLSKIWEENVVVYNGAVSEYHSGQEFLKLCRDGLDLKPSIVISFDGVTEMGGMDTTVKRRKLVHKYQWRMWENIIECPGAIPDSLHMRNLKKLSAGMDETLCDSEVWINNERKMHAICEEFDIKFVGCLQPMIARGYVLDAQIKALLDDMGVNTEYYSQQMQFMKEALERMRAYKYLKDLTMLFDGKENMYHDSMHYTEQGNQVIADAVAKLVMEELRPLFT